mmetsp:Transcript_36206/g.84853  ORF Transcript_36206/g.84853 Transcript_36206/m.84853 type:complete len:206 (-) Transcript_36206:2669-3286(-)
MPNGRLKDAAPPIPSADPGDPQEPATVVTIPESVSTPRIQSLLMSATSARAPVGVIAMEVGVLNDADAPLPFANPAIPDPAKVVTSPVESMILRTLWPPASVTRATRPSGEVAIPKGVLKSALMPVPSVESMFPLPATVVTLKFVPSSRRSSRRIRWLLLSAISTADPSEVIARPAGCENIAVEAGPSAYPCAGLPARVSLLQMS